MADCESGVIKTFKMNNFNKLKYKLKKSITVEICENLLPIQIHYTRRYGCQCPCAVRVLPMSKALDNLERLRALLKMQPLNAASLSQRLGISSPQAKDDR